MSEEGVLTPEAHQYLLEVGFLGKGAVATVYLGLSKRSTAQPPTLSELRAREPKNENYKRQAIAIADWRLNKDGVVSKTLRFSNFSDADWPLVDLWFLATSPDEGGMLLAWGALRAPRQLMRAGDELFTPAAIGFGKHG
mgnify:FL=1